MGIQDRDYWRERHNPSNTQQEDENNSHLQYVLLRRELERQRRINRYGAIGQLIVTGLLLLYAFRHGGAFVSCVLDSVSR